VKKRNGQWEFKKNDFSSYVRRMKIHSGDTILFKDGTITEAGLKEFAKAVQDIKIDKVVLLVVKDVNDVRNLTEVEMNKSGWFRIEALSKIVMDRQKSVEIKAQPGDEEVDDKAKTE